MKPVNGVLAVFAVAMLATTALVGLAVSSSDVEAAEYHPNGTQWMPYVDFDGSAQDLYHAAQDFAGMYHLIYYLSGANFTIHDGNGYYANIGVTSEYSKPLAERQFVATSGDFSDNSVSWTTAGVITGTTLDGSTHSIVIKGPGGVRTISLRERTEARFLADQIPAGTHTLNVPKGVPIFLPNMYNFQGGYEQTIVNLTQCPPWISHVPKGTVDNVVSGYYGIAQPGTYSLVGTIDGKSINYTLNVPPDQIPYVLPEVTSIITGNNWSYQPTTLAGVALSVAGASWLTASGNMVYGTPTQAGTYNVVVTMAKSGYATANVSFTLYVSSELVVILGPTNGTIVYEV